LITPYNTSLPDGRAIAEHPKKGEGAVTAALQISSAEQTPRDLRAAGMKIDGPTPGTIMLAGEKEPPPPRWWLQPRSAASTINTRVWVAERALRCTFPDAVPGFQQSYWRQSRLG